MPLLPLYEGGEFGQCQEGNPGQMTLGTYTSSSAKGERPVIVGYVGCKTIDEPLT